MDVRHAADLIRLKDGFGPAAETWYDLGCGTGTFTMALAQLLPSGSVVYAVDRNARSLKRIPDDHEGVSICKMTANFLEDSFGLPALDGVLMANSLHFVKQQSSLVAKVANAAARVLVVEYEGDSASFWRPYPVPYYKLQALLLRAGYTSVAQLAEHASRYGGKIYSAVAVR
jgi:ubiquinone/menaquinone biosynthesis C-methylase UbiE